MPERSAGEVLDMLVGGAGAVRFAVPLERVGHVEPHDDLPAAYRSVNLPLLFDLPTAADEEDRYARVMGVEGPAYLRLGPVVRVENLSSRRVEPIPPILGASAARWGWAALARTKDGDTVVVIDATRLARLGAERRREGAPGTPLIAEDAQ